VLIATDLKEAKKKIPALPFAVQIGYVSKDTIKFLLAKAWKQGKSP
jgi:hypothetical protein